ncbi:hypothetical protein [Kutzneria sp. CA-103260]|uniref:hypothetical protein n=1 Tax=Kutzneria sp. CA-103260 TaxID=2802641 RepID=UPI001BA4B542|nr:hypothetical protein [Kutzneria sp. CA-103260]QUQ72522.1 hypothetical protein JJ691_103110 [Kutzneria sp. CA-103260]
MTIYSHHASRGKVQILATYRGSTGVVSSTVTSVDDLALATPIVDALNRISAYATVPVSVYDKRGDRFDHYPTAHLAALTGRDARASLLEGAHSLWYEMAMVLLHQALTDLDAAVAAVPEPVRKAISAELEADARGLRDELAEYTEGVAPPELEKRRFWDFKSPFVDFGESTVGLDQEDRDRLNDLEQGVSKSRLDRAVADMRLLLAAHQQCANSEARLLVSDFEITDDPYDEEADRYFLDVLAPIPGGRWQRDGWKVEICRWVPDDPEDEYGGATGEPVLDCVRAEPPTLSEIVELLNRSDGQSDVLAAWAKTAVGEVLAGTAFVVTKRYED